MNYADCITALQDYANAPESAGVDNEFFINVVRVMKEQEDQNKELKEKYEQGVKHVLTLTEEIKELKEEVAELWLDNGSLGRQDKELKQERDNLREEVAELKQELKDISMSGIKHTEQLTDELKELKQHNLFLMAECCAGGWDGRDNDPHAFANDVKEYFEEYKKTHKIENVEELYKEWAEWANID